MARKKLPTNVVKFRKPKKFDPRKSPIYAISVDLMLEPNAKPMPRVETPLGALSTVDLPDKDQAVMAACLREAADMIDPDLWIPTMDCEGVSVHREHALWLVEQTLESCEPQAFPFIDATYGTPECITLTTDLLCERNDELRHLPRAALEKLVTTYYEREPE